MAQHIEKIFGPPGTGKTSRLLELLEQELEQGVEPREIAYLSFTRAAVGEARKRTLAKFADLAEDDLGSFRTMHSLAYRALGLRPDRVASGKILFEFGQKTGFLFEKPRRVFDPDDILLGEVTGAEISFGTYLLSIWDFIRNSLWDLETGLARYPQEIHHPWFKGLEPGQVVRQFVREYEDWKGDNGLLDFADFLREMLRKGQPLRPPVRTIFCDEVQDFSPLQWQVLGIWAGYEVERLYLAGDDDQAIFTFQGASPELFLQHPGRESVRSLSYRLPKKIWEYSQRLITQNTNRKRKEFIYHREGGRVEYLRSVEDICQDICRSVETGENSWFILARNRYLLDNVEELLRLYCLPYHHKRGYSPFDSSGLMRACRIALRFRTGEIRLDELNHLVQDYVESKRPLLQGGSQVLVVRGGKKLLAETATRYPGRPVGRIEATAFGLTSSFFELLDTSPLELIKFKDDKVQEHILGSFDRFGERAFNAGSQVSLGTIHSVKGEEATSVVMLSDVSGSCHRNQVIDPEGERRVFYVGATRARGNLYLVEPQTARHFPL